MRYSILIFSVLLIVFSVCISQKKQIDTSSLNIITKVPFNGQYYFIKITPIEKGNPDHMPIIGNKLGSNQKTIFWNDSLQRILPDSILHILKERPKLK